MNCHCPQSYEAHTELEEIAAVPMQIIRPRDGQPVIGVVQDTLVGAHLATKPGNRFNRREFMNLMMRNKRFHALPAAGDDGKYTGQQVISTMLAPVNMKMNNGLYDSNKVPENTVIIQEGEVKQGVFDKGTFNKPGAGIVHTTYNDYGPKEAVQLIDSMQNVLENYLIMKGFSVGISDLVPDEETQAQMQQKIATAKAEVADIAMQVHMDLFTNNSGKSNQEEFEARISGALGRAFDAGKIGQTSLSPENRLIAMINAGSKGSSMNIAQMLACVGPVSIEGKRIPYGFADRTLPHYKKFDDGPEARGFVESCFLRGLTPQEFFFHAMSGREGLIDTAVKSVTGDTPIVILEEGVPKYVEIGPWIDSQLAADAESVEHFTERQMELLQVDKKVFIPTMDEDGVVTWGALSAITRHDPGTELYEIKTSAGKKVIVTESKSLLTWNAELGKFKEVPTPEVKVGDYVPVTMNLCEPPTFVEHIEMTKYFPKDKYVYGTDFHKATSMVQEAMEGRTLIPNGWWDAHNGIDFTLPYEKKSSLVRALSRSNIENIKEGCIYPYHASRESGCMPSQFTLNKVNGIFLGLFLAEGNANIPSGTVQITNINENVKNFVKEWFDSHSIKWTEKTYENYIGGTTSGVIGYSKMLAQFFTELVGHGSHNKYIPSEAFVAHHDFVAGLLNGYFSGDGTITRNSVEAGSASARLTEGIAMLCSRLGIFGKVFTTQTKSNNIGTEHIAPSHRIAIRAQWAKKFADNISLLDDKKDAKLKELQASEEHRNYPVKNDVVMDKIVEINIIDVAKYPKVYDLTIPSTLNFGLANGLQVRDTSDTGYTQRQLIKAMEDVMIQHDGTVRDAAGNIIQFHYGEDGTNSTKIEGSGVPMERDFEKTDTEIVAKYSMNGVDLTPYLKEDVTRQADAEALLAYANEVAEDRHMIIKYVYGMSKNSQPINTPLNLERIILNMKTKFGLRTQTVTTDDQGRESTVQVRTNLTPLSVINGINTMIKRTQPYNKIWVASLRFFLAPHKMIVDERFTQEAWDALVETVVVKNYKSWAVPGELVGIIAAQSIGEPTTQMTLNTFHLAGVAAKSNMTRGVPRVKELLKVTHNPKATSLTVYLKPAFRENKDAVREVLQDFELTLLKDIVQKSAIYYDPHEGETVIAEDRELLEFYNMFEALEPAERKSQSKWLLRLTFDREKMFNKNITMDDVNVIVTNKFTDQVKLTYSDYNSQRLVMRIRLDPGDTVYGDHLEGLKKFQNKLLNSVIVRGLPGVKSASMRKYKDALEYDGSKYVATEQYIIDTDGSNYTEVMVHPAVDGSKLYSTNVHDIYEHLGIEATRQALYIELKTVFEDANVNYRHMGLLVDVMTRGGKLMSIDRYGINKINIGPLAKASFEETEKMLLKAALFGEVDPVTGVSANIMMGQTMRGGTAFSQIMLDEVALPRLLEGLPAVAEEEDEGIRELSDTNIGAVLYEDPNDACSKTRLQMNFVMPKAKIAIGEDDEDDVGFVVK